MVKFSELREELGIVECSEEEHYLVDIVDELVKKTQFSDDEIVEKVVEIFQENRGL